VLKEALNLPTTLASGNWHSSSIQFANGTLTVILDGTTVISSYAIAGYVAAPYYFGFAGATGSYSELHEIRNVTITFATPHCL